MVLSDYYSNKIKLYGMPPRREEAILKLLENNITGKQILDIGCADGSFGEKLVKKGAIVTGLDISRKALRLAKKNLNHTILVDLNDKKWNLNRESYDLIIASEVIEHLFEPINFLINIKRILKKNGLFVLSTPNFLYWGHRINFLKGHFSYRENGPFDRSHIHFYTYQTLKKDLNISGFRIIKERHIGAGNKLNFIKRKFPAVFAYQFLILCQK